MSGVRGIWRHAGLYDTAIDEAARVTLGEGDTPLVPAPSLARHIGIGALWLKRDDLSPGGSHKARSLAWRISLARMRGEKTVLLSSSGNAAAAASLYCAVAGVRLLAFVSPQTAAVKLNVLRRSGTWIVRTPKPRNMARYAARVFDIPNLTPSMDDHAIEGFKSIAAELREEAPEVEHFFSFATSGSSFIGVGRAARALGHLRDAASQAEAGLTMHAVGAGANGLLAGALDERFPTRTWVPSRRAGLLGIDESPRADEARAFARDSGGRGWVLDDDEIVAAHAALRASGIDTSGEGAACLAAVIRGRAEGVLHEGSKVAILLTGHGTQWPVPSDESQADEGEIHDVESYVDLKRLLEARP